MKRSGLTLIELLVAMSILAIIVLAVAQIFQQSTVAWESGYRRTRTAMVGRAILGYVAEDVGLAISPSGLSFELLDGTNVFQTIDYSPGVSLSRSINHGSGTLLYENSDALEQSDFSIGFGPIPAYYADVSLNVKTSDKGRDETRKFTTRVYLVNRNRYYYD